MTKLSTALRGADSAIYKTQTQLNKLQKAAKVDPAGGYAAMGKQLGALSQQAVNTAASIKTLKTGIDELGSTGAAGGGTIGELLDGTESITLAAEQARAKYSELGGELEKANRGIRELTGIDLSKATRNGNYDLAKQSAINAADEKDKASVAQQIALIDNLKDKWEEAERALSDYDDAAQLDKLKNKLIEQEASFRAINQQIVEVSRNLAQSDRYETMPDIGKDLENTNRYLTLISAAADTANSRFSTLDSAMKVDPSNLETSRERTEALAEAMQTAQMQSSLLKDRLSAYEAAGIDSIAKSFGSVAVEVQQAERSWMDAKTQLDMFKASGEENVEKQRQLEQAVSSAQQRMDTAHACEQYNNLKARVADVDAQFVKMGKSVADITVPSEVARSMSSLKSAFENISKSLKSTESDAKSFDSALKLNPNNVTIAATQMDLLKEAERLAKEEAESLRQQLDNYDTGAIEQATEQDKSAMRQLIDASEEYERACERVRDIRVQMSNTQEGIDTSKDQSEIHELEDVLGNLKSELQEAEAAKERAFQHFDLSKGRKEVQELETAVAKNEATQDRLYATMQKLSGVELFRKTDLSSVEKMKTTLDSLKDQSFEMDGLGYVGDRLKSVTASLDEAKDRFKQLDDASKIDPNNLALAEDRSRALAQVTQLATEKSTLLSAAYARFKPDKVNETAIATGRVGEYAERAARDAEAAFAKMEQAAGEVRTKEQELAEFPVASLRTDEGVAKFNELQSELDRLKQKYEEAEAAAKKAFADFSTAKATQESQRLRTEIHQNDAELSEFKSKAQELSAVDATPKIDKDWSDSLKAAEDRFDRINKVMQENPTGFNVATQRAAALKEAIGAAESKVSSLKSRMAELEGRGIDKAAKSLGNVAVATQNAEKAAREAKQSVDALEKEYEQAKTKAKGLKDEMGRTGKGATEYRRARQEVDDLKQKLDEAKRAQQEADAAASTAHLCSEYKEAGIEVAELENKIRNLGKTGSSGAFGQVTTAAVQAASEVGQVMRDVGQKVVTSSDEIDKSYRNLRKTFDAEEGEYQTLYDAAMQYSQGHVTSASSMLDMEAIAAQLGIGVEGGAEAIQTFAEACADLDVATDIDAETIALQLGQITNVMSDMDPQKARNFADALVRLGNNMPTQESNIMQITQRLSAIGDVAHFKTPELLGWASAIASTGQKSEAAASGIVATITKISQAVSGGGDDLKKWAEIAGMSADKFAEEWKSKPSETLKAVVKGLRDSGDELFATLSGLEINGVRQNQTLASLAQTIDTVDGAIGMASEAFQGGGDAANEANKKAEGFSGTLAKLQNSAQVLAAEFGNAMVPFMEQAATAIQKLTEYISGMSDEAKTLAVVIGGAFAGFAVAEPVIAAIGGNFLKMGKGIGSISLTAIKKISNGLGGFLGAESKLQFFATGLGNVTGKIGGFASAAGLAVNPLGLFAGAMIAAVAATAGFVYFKWKEAQDHAKELSDTFQTMRDNVKGLNDTMGEAPEGVDKYSKAIEDARDAHKDFFDTLKEHNDRNTETRESMEDTIGRLEYYKQVVEECAGAGEISAEKQLELQNALDGIEEITGKVWDVEDVLTGTYKDQEGAVRDTISAIEDLIAVKEREARVNAITDMYSEAIKAQIKGEQAVKKSREAYKEAYKEFKKSDYGDTVASGLRAQGLVEGTDEFKNAMRLAFRTGTEDGTELWQQLQDDKAALKECKEEAGTLKEAFAETLKEGQAAGEIGVRESRILGSRKMREAAESVGLEGDRLRDFCKGLQDAMGDTAAAEQAFTSITSQQFADMASHCGGDIDNLTSRIVAFAQLDVPDKESAVWVDDQTLELANGEIYIFNGTELVKKEGDVEVNGAEEANAKLDSVQANSEEDATMEANAETSGLDEANAEIDEMQANAEEGANANFTASGTEDIANAVDKLRELTDAQVNITFNVDDGGIAEATEALKSLQDEDVKVAIKADTSGAEQITTALSGLSGKPIDVKINADTSGATEIATALSDLSDKPVNVKINADTSGAQQVTDALANISDKPIDVKINADTSGATEIANAIANITANNPIDMQATITAVTNGVAAATTRIQKLNEVSAAMKSQKKTYTASGNAATSSSPANNIRNLNSAAANMSGNSATYTAYGNAASGSAASHVWDLVNAVNSLYSKSVTITTTYNTIGSPPGHSATGAYIPPNKIPKHAAGIFTQPTLTNIGWVGESGAELYSGNSLVPLTNRKYSMPYIDDISDAVAKKLGGSGTTYNVSIDGARINDDPAIQAAILNLFDVLERKGAMNRG